jgi:hypothetical protein
LESDYRLLLLKEGEVSAHDLYGTEYLRFPTMAEERNKCLVINGSHGSLISMSYEAPWQRGRCWGCGIRTPKGSALAPFGRWM